ncbi:SPOR domain-containing protein [Oculatella sp. LEGE 06141]|uniref:SPOR domain-containing protein n=1 Tax=Oculatella sp. LEGE 06141 TaxID=1828648 RepID=UPI001882BB61|nr:SPOR domain-containing protein [Oculatella sp. LEGE 06141]MBE9179918.1 SPOR domain-containing protein [Oculatella sp. LEGE 06141]
MRRRSPQSSPDLSDVPTLHPALQGVFDSLDVDLEEELALYRRRRDDRPTPRSRGRSRPPQRAGAAATAGRLQLPNPTRAASHTAIADDDGSQQDLWQSTSAASPSVPAAQLALLAATSSVPAQAQAEPIGQTQLQSNLATVHQSPSYDLAQPDPGTAEPDDYLASSEELLRSLADEEKELRAEQEPALLDTLLTPLGIGSMLLLLLSSATLGYLIMNPSSLNLAGLKSLFGDRSTSEVASETASGQAVGASGNSVLPNSPNLASEEFVDLSLSNLGTLPADRNVQPSVSPSPAQPSPGAAPAPAASPEATTNRAVAAQNPADLPTVPIPRSAPAVVAPAPVRSAPPVAAAPARSAPAPARSAPAPAQPAPVQESRRPAPPARIAPPPSVVAAPASVPASPPPVVAAPSTPTPVQEEYYHVVTEFSSDRSLEQVREAVPDAYVRNFSNGARVQAGAFNSQEGAADLVRELSEQGISAEVYRADE